ncbi:MAG: HAD family phosphatase [Bacteroidales bacterium]|nr:HAD family phosphatase [Bacteroidales bacterium]
MIGPDNQLKALIFDMDGVLVDNHAFHQKAWIEFCRRYGIDLTPEEFSTKIFGGGNRDILERVFQRKMNDEEVRKMAFEKEKLYREMHAPFLEPTKGVREFLSQAVEYGFLTAVATAAPRENLNFVLENTGLEKFFKVKVDDSMVQRSKPEPDIYLFCTKMLGVTPENCLVFEDSLTGIRAAQTAGIKVVGVATSLNHEQLSHTWKVIDNFEQISVKDLIQ